MNDDSLSRQVTDSAVCFFACVAFAVVTALTLVVLSVGMFLIFAFIVASGSVIGLVAVVDMAVSGIAAASNALMGRTR